MAKYSRLISSMVPQRAPSPFLEVFGRVALCLPFCLSCVLKDSRPSYVLQQSLEHSTYFVFNRGPTTSHLHILDDLLLFAKVDISQVGKLKIMFSIYEDCYCQTINYDKSVYFFFSRRAPDNLRQEICSFLRIPKGWGNKNYLGLPFMTGQLRRKFQLSS